MRPKESNQTNKKRNSKQHENSKHKWKERYLCLKFLVAGSSCDFVLEGKQLSHMKYQDLYHPYSGAQWLSGRVLDSRPMGSGSEPHRHHYVVSLSKNINPSLVLDQPS